MDENVRIQKERERVLREREVPFGEFTVREKTAWFSLVEMENVRSRLRLGRMDRVLDAGASDGRFLEYLRRKGNQGFLCGIDFALNPLRKLKGKDPSFQAVCADICAIPFGEGTFDRIVVCQVLQQISSREERRRALRGLHRALGVGGRCAIQVLNRTTWRDMVENGVEGQLKTSPDLYVYLYDETTLRAELTGAGFVVREVVAINLLPVRYLRMLGLAGLVLDMMLTRFCRGLSFRKGRYLLAICEKV